MRQLTSRQKDSDPRKFQWPDYPLQEVMFLAERRISLFWIVHGQTRMSTSLRSSPGPVSESPRSLTIGSDGWLLTIFVLQSLFLVGPSTDKAVVGALWPQINFLTRLSLGSAIQIHAAIPASDLVHWRGPHFGVRPVRLRTEKYVVAYCSFGSEGTARADGEKRIGT